MLFFIVKYCIWECHWPINILKPGEKLQFHSSKIVHTGLQQDDCSASFPSYSMQYCSIKQPKESIESLTNGRQERTKISEEADNFLNLLHDMWRSDLLNRPKIILTSPKIAHLKTTFTNRQWVKMINYSPEW